MRKYWKKVRKDEMLQKTGGERKRETERERESERE